MDRDALVQELRHSGEEALAGMLGVDERRLSLGAYESGWTVREVMAHVAAMEFSYRRLPDLARSNSGSGGGGTFDMDAYNARQVSRRAERTRSELIDEFLRGRARLIVEAAALDPELLQRSVRSAGGSAGTLAGVIAAVAGGHVRGHTRDFLQAAGAPPGEGVRLSAALQLAAEEAAARCEDLATDAWSRGAEAGAWSPGNIAGHIAEVMPYWVEMTARALGDPDLVLGRDLDAPERLGATLGGAAMLPVEAAAAIRDAAARAGEAVLGIPDESWSQPVQTRRFGTLPAVECVRELAVNHVREHIDQLVAAASIAG